MRKIISGCFLFFLFAALTAFTPAKLDSALQARFAQNGHLPITIILNSQAGDLANETAAFPRTRQAGRTADRLRTFSRESQAGILTLLNTGSRSGAVSNVHSLWIVNAIACETDRATIIALSDRPEVEFIAYDDLIPMLPDGIESSAANDSRAVGYQITKTNADDVWALGYDGTGITVALIDSGVNYNHVDLSDHMWNGGTSYPNHGYDFLNNDTDPVDDNGHGSHCAGIIAGDGSGTNRTGIAPNAAVMALKAVNASGSGRETTVLRALEFAIEHGADVISISLGWYSTISSCRSLYRMAMEHVMNAGIVAAVAAGNEGATQSTYPIPHNVRTPGDCPPPWRHPDQSLTGGLSAVITCGNTTSTDAVNSTSSRGPSTWQDEAMYGDYPYAPGIGLIDPDVSAPGTSIVSASHTSNTGYVTKSGTSMATPCLAGVIALMLQKDPSLTPAQIDELLETHAVPLATGKNNDSGSGRIDALATINAVATPGAIPGMVSSPDPVNSDTNVLLPVHLTWQPASNALSYKLYAGTNNPPSNLVNGENLTNCNYTLTAAITDGSIVFWRVDAVRGGNTTTGTVYSFHVADAPDEGFEGGVSRSWSTGSVGAWGLTSVTAHTGSGCLVSGDIGDSLYTFCEFTQYVTSPGWIGFYEKTSSELDWDCLYFFIDGVMQLITSGVTDWTPHRFHVEAGVHYYTWYYSKDSNTSVGSDCAWIDDIVLPPESRPVASGDLLISEISDNPTGTDEGTGFIELFNPGTASFSLEGLSLLRGIVGSGFTPDGTYTFPAGAYIAGKDRLIIATGANTALFASAWELSSTGNFLEGSTALQVTGSSRGYQLQAASTRGSVITESPDIAVGERKVQLTPGSWSPALSADSGTPGANDAGQTLPVELSGFLASVTAGNTVSLQWIAQSETDMQGYTVFRTRTNTLDSATPISELIPARNVVETHTYGFIDTDVETGQTYSYYLESLSLNGEVSFHGPVTVSVTGNPGTEVPPVVYLTALNGNFPNPFNPNTTIRFTLAESKPVTLAVFNLRGQVVRHFSLGACSAGVHTVNWDGTTDCGTAVGSGVYLLRMRTGEQVFHRYMMLMK
jgi:subtilisin family serine protease